MTAIAAATVAMAAVTAAAVTPALGLAAAARGLGFARGGGSSAAWGLGGAAHLAASIPAAAVAVATFAAAAFAMAAVAAASHLATAATAEIEQLDRERLGRDTHQPGSQRRHNCSILHGRLLKIRNTGRRKRKQPVAGTAGPAMFTSVRQAETLSFSDQSALGLSYGSAIVFPFCRS
jgi:hypothetical protein